MDGLYLITTWKKGSAADQPQLIHAIMNSFVDIDILIIDPLLSVNLRTMCPKTLGMENVTQHRPFGNLGHKVLPLQALMGDIEIIVKSSKGYKCVYSHYGFLNGF